MRTGNRSLGDVLFGQTRGSILAYLYGHPDERYYTRQIARNVRTSVGTVQRELQSLSAVGLVTRSRLGSQVFYQANQDSPVFSEVRALAAKTTGIFYLLRSGLEPVAPRIKAAFVYGSLARQEENATSDIDLMIIGSVSVDEVLVALESVEASIGRAVNPTAYSVAEYRSKLASGNHFLKSVLRGKKVFLLGDEDGLKDMGGVRLAEARTDKS